MKNLKYIFLAIVSLFIASCSNFEDINTNPDKSTSAKPDLLASNTLVKTFKLANSSADTYTQITLFNHHITKLSSSPDPGQYYWSYSPFGSFSNYKYLTDLKDMVTFSEGSTSQSSYKGLALFLKAYYGFAATLDMGDVPYSEAGLGKEGNTKPVYDKQEFVFSQILKDLQEAEVQFAKGAVLGGDIMYNGDAKKWRRLCNAMQLKVIQTMSKKATTEQKARFAAIVSAGNLMANNADDLKLVYTENTNATYPFYNANNQRLYMAPSKLAVDFLKSNNDNRLFYFADPAPAKITGGLTQTDFNAYVGAPNEMDANTLSINSGLGMYSVVNLRYTKFRDNDPLLYFTYAEQCFIIAEAIEEGWVPGGSAVAKTYYENGVKDQLAYYKSLPRAAGLVHGKEITQTYIDNYFTGEAAYKTAGTKQDRLKQILTQRWVTYFFQPNSTCYPQFLRTGYPQYILNPITSLNADDANLFPKRWKYPTSEASTNPVNYKKAIDEQYAGIDNTMAIPWYLK